jgi:hypothetical protein
MNDRGFHRVREGDRRLAFPAPDLNDPAFEMQDTLGERREVFTRRAGEPVFVEGRAVHPSTPPGHASAVPAPTSSLRGRYQEAGALP